MTGSDIICRASLEELIGHRNRTLELYRLGLESMAQALETQNKCSPGVYCNRPHDLRYCDRASMGDIRREVDRGVWCYLLEQSGLKNVMDHTAIEQFHAQLEKDPPEVTMDNLVATFTAMSEDRQGIFERGCIKLFDSLNHKWRSNDAFRLGARVVINYGFNVYRYSGRNDLGSMTERAQNSIRDLDRVMHVIDGKPPHDHLADAAAKLREGSNSIRGQGGEVQCDYFRARWFLNGNIHLLMDRLDLVEQVNRIVARHKGETLADASMK